MLRGALAELDLTFGNQRATDLTVRYRHNPRCLGDPFWEDDASAEQNEMTGKNRSVPSIPSRSDAFTPEPSDPSLQPKHLRRGKSAKGMLGSRKISKSPIERSLMIRRIPPQQRIVPSHDRIVPSCQSELESSDFLSPRKRQACWQRTGPRQRTAVPAGSKRCLCVACRFPNRSHGKLETTRESLKQRGEP